MSRTIKFKAKSLINIPDDSNIIIAKGKWVYGDIVYDCSRVWIDTEYYGQILVDKNTVSEFTGIYDKNDNEIYEGDVILTQPLKDRPFSRKAKSKKLKGIVKHNIGYGKNFIDKPDKVRYWSAEWDVEIIDKKDYQKYNNCAWGLFFDCEMIGNIIDNKNLSGEE